MKTEAENKAETVIALVSQMRENAEEMRIWKNIPIAKQCVKLLQEIDDPEEPPIGKAMACRAIVDKLPEYETPRLVLDILRYELEMIRLSDEEPSEHYPTEEEVLLSIQRLEDYIDTRHVTDDEFNEKYKRYLKSDHIMRTPRWEEIYYEVQEECDRRLGDEPRGMGFCFGYWSALRQVLREHGMHWQSPSELNPDVIFD